MIINKGKHCSTHWGCKTLAAPPHVIHRAFPFRNCRFRPKTKFHAFSDQPSEQGDHASSNNSSNQKQPRRRDDNALDQEIASIALPMLATLAADPIAGLVDTAYIGRLGAVQLAGVGVALSIFHTITKLFNVPVLSVTTSSVAMAKGDDAVVQAASSALYIAAGVGLLQALLLAGGAEAALAAWGVPAESPLLLPALGFLRMRALGAPITAGMVTLQGVFRGLQDTRTPFYATVASCVINVVLTPLLLFGLRLGVEGAAAATVLSQMVPCVYLLWELNKRVSIRLSDSATLDKVVKLFTPTGWLMLRTVASSATYALATATAARAGPAAAAAHSICFQLWLASSLLSDSLAVAGQTLVARSLAQQQQCYAQQVVSRSGQLALAMGLSLAAVLAVFRHAIPKAFASDPMVLLLVSGIMPLVVVTQPINAMAFIADGMLFGVNGFRYASAAMAAAAVPSILAMLVGASSSIATNSQLLWVWIGLGLLMTARAASIWVPYYLKAGPFATLASVKQS